jgi:plastocyanin
MRGPIREIIAIFTHYKKTYLQVLVNHFMVTCLIALTMVVVSATISSLFMPVYAQAGGAQEESEGDLTVVINGETFTTGQTIVFSGSVDGSIAAGPYIYIYDPEGNQIAFDAPNLSADNTFTFSLVAGDNDEPGLLAEEPMDTSGNYRVSVSISPSFTSTDEVDMEFEYIVTPTPEQEEQQEQAAPTTSAGGAATGITSQQAASPPSLPSTMFQSNVDGIRVGVPGGWVFEDINNTDPGLRQAEQNYGAGVLIELCPQNQATPQIGGIYLCPEAEEGLDSVSVWRFADLKSRPEFAGVVQQNQSITTNDLVAYYFLFLEQKANFTNIKLLQNVDTTVNVIDPRTGVSIATAPGKYIQTSYLNANGTPNEGDSAILVLDNDGNTGYAILPVASSPTATGELPPEHQLVFDSFELIAANNTTISNSTTATSGAPSSSPSPFSQQLQLQEQRLERQPSSSPQLPQAQQQESSSLQSPSSLSSDGSGVTSEPTINILEGSAVQGSPDYDPEELTVSAGSDVTVVNQDTLPHTVTYGTGTEDTNSALFFDTSIVSAGESIIISLASELNPGRYDYYCLIHPYMKGTIIVER